VNTELIVSGLGLLSVPLLVMLNAFFVAAEFALVAVRRSRVDEMVNHRRVGAVAVRNAIDHAIAATQLGITLASLALGWVGEPIVARLIEPLFAFMPAEGAWIARHTVATVLAFIGITFLHVILGELAPKAVALQRPDMVALWVARPLLWFARLMRRRAHAGLRTDQRTRNGPLDGRSGAHRRRIAPSGRAAARSGRVRAQRVSPAGQEGARLPGAAGKDGRPRTAHA
jgi:hypothetical protein